MNTKICRKCGIEKISSEFSPARKGSWVGLNSWCKECHRQNAKLYRKTDSYKDVKNRFDEKINLMGGYYAVYTDTIKRTQHNYRVSLKGRKKNIQRQNRRREMIKSNGGKIKKAKWEALLSYYAPNYVCPSCGEKKKIVKDHIIPVVLGGTSNPSNIQPLCKSCNAKKRIKIIDYRFDFGLFAEGL